MFIHGSFLSIGRLYTQSNKFCIMVASTWPINFCARDSNNLYVSVNSINMRGNACENVSEKLRTCMQSGHVSERNYRVIIEII